MQNSLPEFPHAPINPHDGSAFGTPPATQQWQTTQLQSLQDELQKHFLAVKQQEAKLIAARGGGSEEGLSVALMQADFGALQTGGIAGQLDAIDSQLSQLGAQFGVGVFDAFAGTGVQAGRMFPASNPHLRAWTTEPSALRTVSPGGAPGPTIALGRARMGSIADDPLNVRALGVDSPVDSVALSSASPSELSFGTSSKPPRRRGVTASSVVSAGRRSRHPTDAPDDLAEVKRERNRTHAQRSRLKKQQYYRDLEAQMAMLRAENGQLKHLMTELLRKVGDAGPSAEFRALLSGLEATQAAQAAAQAAAEAAHGEVLAHASDSDDSVLV